MNDPLRTGISRRTVLATTGTGLASLGAGCLSDAPDLQPSEDSSDESLESDAIAPARRWIPAAERDDLQFSYADLGTIRTHLGAGVVEELSPISGQIERELVEEATADGTTLDRVVTFGSTTGRDNHVISGAFDPAAVADHVEFDDEHGAFDIVESNLVTMAISTETIVLAADEGRTKLDAILTAGLDGTDRRVDDDEAFETLLETVGDGTYAIGTVYGDESGPHPLGSAAGGYSWSIESERSSLTLAAVDDETDGPGSEDLEDAIDRAGLEERYGDLPIESEGTVAVATTERATDGFDQYDLSLDTEDDGGDGGAVNAAVEIILADEERTVTVLYASSGSAERIVIEDDDGRRKELTEVGSTVTLEYDAGASGIVRVIAVDGDTESLVATQSYSF